MAVVMSKTARAKPITPTTLNTPATAPVLLQNEVGELCTLDDDVMEGVTDVKIVTTTPPDVVSNCVTLGETVVGTTNVDVCCSEVVDAFEAADVDVDADVAPVEDADAPEELVCGGGDVELVAAAEVVDGAAAGLEVVAGAGPPPVLLEVGAPVVGSDISVQQRSVRNKKNPASFHCFACQSVLGVVHDDEQSFYAGYCE